MNRKRVYSLYFVHIIEGEADWSTRQHVITMDHCDDEKLDKELAKSEEILNKRLKPGFVKQLFGGSVSMPKIPDYIAVFAVEETLFCSARVENE